MYTLPPLTLNGLPPRPTLTVVSPIRLSGPHVPAFASASPHSFTPESRPLSPGGMCSWMPCRFCWPSARLIVVVNGVNAPAWRFRLPVASDGLNVNGLSHGLSLGPLVIWNVEDGSTCLLYTSDAAD